MNERGPQTTTSAQTSPGQATQMPRYELWLTCNPTVLHTLIFSLSHWLQKKSVDVPPPYTSREIASPSRGRVARLTLRPHRRSDSRSLGLSVSLRPRNLDITMTTPIHVTATTYTRNINPFFSHKHKQYLHAGGHSDSNSACQPQSNTPCHHTSPNPGL